jgi:peptidoglycan/LPS O-acetylase OafA/YrhL
VKDSPNLDLLRSIAVGLVVFSHLRFFLGWQSGAVYSLDTLGRLGVAIFFVHTTLVLMMSLERQPGTRAFFVRRFFRLYPLAAFMVLLTALMLYRFGKPVPADLVLANLLLIQNLTGHDSIPGPLWSLPMEVQMYLVLPALYAVTKSARPLLWTALLCAGALALGAAGFAAFPKRAPSFPLQYVPCFLPGVLAYVLGRRVTARFSPLTLFGVVALAALTIPFVVAAGVPETPAFWGVCLALGITIPLCRQIPSGMIAKCAKTVATYSYGIYLTHMMALWFAFSNPLPWFVQWGIFLVMLPGLALIAYRWIEAPGIALGVRLSTQVQTKTTGRTEDEPCTTKPLAS